MTAPAGFKLGQAPLVYNHREENQMRQRVQDELDRCVKLQQEYQPPRLVLADTVTGVRYVVTIASGSLTLTAIA